jgi:TolB-like protein
MSTGPEVLSGVFADRYAIEGEIGRGATAVVHLARDLSSDRLVAVKILREALQDSTASTRFLREIEHQLGLVHPRIVPVLDWGTADGRPYLVLPYVTGGTLRQHLQQQRQLSYTDAIAIAIAIGDALSHAHKAGIVHRDVKPENILFANGEAQLADFGIAKALERATGDVTTSTGVVRGTPAYVSPEQAGGQVDYDGRSDVYSLGCVLYEMIAGVPAFMGPTPQSVISQRLTFRPTPVSQFRDTVPPALEAIIDRSMMLVPADRYQTADEMVLALQRASADASAPVRRRPNRLRTRRRLTVLGGTLALGVAAVAAITLLPRPAVDPGTVPEGDPRRIAVLYFDPLTPDALPEHVADGITEDLIDRLGGVTALHVTSPTGVRPFRGTALSIDSIQKVLKAGTIVSGSVARSGNALRVDVRLIDAVSGRQLDSKTIDEQWTELFALQDRLAEQVQFWLRQRLGDEIAIRANRAATRSVAAWDAVQLASGETRRAAQSAAVRGDTSSARLFLRADSLYVRANQLDPGWILPIVRRGNLALLALAVRSPVPPNPSDSIRYRALPVSQRRVVWIRRAAELAEEALRRSPGDPLALALRGQAAMSLSMLDPYSDDSLLVRAERDLRMALDRRPNLAAAWSALADLLVQQGRFADGAAAAQRAFDADAFFELRRVLAVAFNASLAAENFAEASRWCRLGLLYYSGDPRFTECTLRILGSSAKSRNSVAQAWQELDRIERRDSLHLLDATWAYRRLLVAAILVRAGATDSARAVLSAVQQDQPAIAKAASEPAEAYVLLLLGDKEAAAQRLADHLRPLPAGQRAPLLGHPWFQSLRGHPRLDSLRRPRT